VFTGRFARLGGAAAGVIRPLCAADGGRGRTTRMPVGLDASMHYSQQRPDQSRTPTPSVHRLARANVFRARTDRACVLRL